MRSVTGFLAFTFILSAGVGWILRSIVKEGQGTAVIVSAALIGVGLALFISSLGRSGSKRAQNANASPDPVLLAKALQFAANAVAITDRDGEILYVNEAFTRLTGYSAEEALGQNARILNSGTHPAEFFQKIWDTISAGGSWHGEMTNRRKNGTHYIEEITITPVLGTDGDVTHYVAIKQDISDRKAADERVRNSEATLKAVLEALPVAVIIADADGRLVELNKSNSELWGEVPRETKSWQKYGDWVGYWPETGERVKSHEWSLARALLTGERVVGDLVEIEKFGTKERRFSLNNAAPVRDDRGNIIAAVVAQLDVTDRIRAERDLRDRERRLRTFFDSDMVGAIYWAMDGSIADANNKFLGMLGYTREDLAAGRMRWPDLTPPEYKCLDEFALSELRERGVDTPYEKEFVRKDGSRVPVIIGAAMLDESRLEGVAFVLDITDRKRAEAQIAAARAAAEHASKAKDQFLAVLSHELRTPLTPVLAAAFLLRDDPSLPEHVRADLEMIQRNVELEARLIDDLLDITRITRGKLQIERKQVELCEILRRAIEICSAEIASSLLDITVDYGPDAPYRLEGDPARLQQVFWNLLKNAIKFSRRGGTIELRCRLLGRNVVTEVQDCGEGIEPEILPHIFNAFEQGGARTTRQFGGLGLGLTITKGLVEAHSGSIVAASDGKGKGAKFCVTLPLAE